MGLCIAEADLYGGHDVVDCVPFCGTTLDRAYYYTWDIRLAEMVYIISIVNIGITWYMVIGSKSKIKVSKHFKLNDETSLNKH